MTCKKLIEVPCRCRKSTTPQLTIKCRVLDPTQRESTTGGRDSLCRSREQCCLPLLWTTPRLTPRSGLMKRLKNTERQRLFTLLRQLMGKKLHEAPEAYAAARAELLLHCDGRLPTLFDPFAGGGSIPLESSRLGFSVQAGDLNPVAVLLNKCNLELAPRWVGQAPVNPTDGSPLGAGKSWRGTHGLAADVRYYSTVIQKRAQAEIGHLYGRSGWRKSMEAPRLPRSHGYGPARWPALTPRREAGTCPSSALTGFIIPKRAVLRGWNLSSTKRRATTGSMFG